MIFILAPFSSDLSLFSMLTALTGPLEGSLNRVRKDLQIWSHEFSKAYVLRVLVGWIFVEWRGFTLKKKCCDIFIVLFLDRKFSEMCYTCHCLTKLILIIWGHSVYKCKCVRIKLGPCPQGICGLVREGTLKNINYCYTFVIH